MPAMIDYGDTPTISKNMYAPNHRTVQDGPVIRGLSLDPSLLMQSIAANVPCAVAPLSAPKTSPNAFMYEVDDDPIIQMDPTTNGPKLRRSEWRKMALGNNMVMERGMSSEVVGSGLAKALADVRSHSQVAAATVQPAQVASALDESPVQVVTTKTASRQIVKPVAKFSQSLFNRSVAAASPATPAVAPPAVTAAPQLPVISVLVDINGVVQYTTQCHAWQIYEGTLVLIRRAANAAADAGMGSIPQMTTRTGTARVLMCVDGADEIYVVEPAAPPLCWNSYEFYFLPIIESRPVPEDVGEYADTPQAL